MIGGQFPLMIITIDYQPLKSFILDNVPKAEKFITTIGGVPIPIYINEELTGVNIVAESRAIDLNIDREQTPSEVTTQEIITQRGISNSVNVELECTKDSVLLQILLGLSDWIFAKGIDNNARISWLNGGMVVFNGLLASLIVRQSALNDRMLISMSIEKPLPEPVNAEEKPTVAVKADPAGRGRLPNV